jgi:hypothetical protein
MPFSLRYKGTVSLIVLVKQLSAQGYAFVDSLSGWPPAAVLQQLRAYMLELRAEALGIREKP